MRGVGEAGEQPLAHKKDTEQGGKKARAPSADGRLYPERLQVTTFATPRSMSQM